MLAIQSMTYRGKSKGRLNRHELDSREVMCLANYYAPDSKTKGNAKQSALAAGYSEIYSADKAHKIIKKYEDCSFRASAKAMGITKPYLAMKLRLILDLPLKDYTKEVIGAMRLALANFGEVTEQGQSGPNVTVAGSAMIIVGQTPTRLKALTGVMSFRRPKKELGVIDAQAQVSNIDGGDAGGNREVAPTEGGHRSGEARGDPELPPAPEAAG